MTPPYGQRWSARTPPTLCVTPLLTRIETQPTQWCWMGLVPGVQHQQNPDPSAVGIRCGPGWAG
jgi:hypothetical protein